MYPDRIVTTVPTSSFQIRTVSFITPMNTLRTRLPLFQHLRQVGSVFHIVGSKGFRKDDSNPVGQRNVMGAGPSKEWTVTTRAI
jgi:hypothetical protein